jgi:hypothetical protein
MSWFWLNIPLCAVIFSVVVGVPLWMVIKHPDTAASYARQDAPARPLAARVPRQRAAAEAGHPAGAAARR